MRIVWLPDPVTRDLSLIARLTRLWGLDGVILRFAGSDSQRVPFVNEDLIRRRLLDEEIGLEAIDPGIFEGDIHGRAAWLNEVYSSDTVFAFCRRLNCGIVQVSAFESGARPSDVAIPLGELLGRVKDGVTVAIKNEPWSSVSTGSELGQLIDEVKRFPHASQITVSASWCPATSHLMHEDTVECSRSLAPVLSVVRCGDVRSDSAERVPFGLGDLRWDELLKSLAAARFDGVLCLDLPEGASRTEGLRAATALIACWRSALQAIGK